VSREAWACLLLAALVLVGACRSSGHAIGVPTRERTRFESEWQSYRDLEPEKALAVAGDVDGAYASGFAFGKASRHEAEQGALEDCARRRADRRLDAPCRLYAVGDEIVADGP
jgi:hypothetical protein